MTVDDLLTQLYDVKQRGNRWTALCPAHADNSPSLSISEGQRGILLKCWAGCTVSEICSALNISLGRLFFDAAASNSQQRRAAAQERARQRAQQEKAACKQGQRIDALRAAETFVASRREMDISRWSDDRLDDELNLLADAHTLLTTDGAHG